MNKEAWGEGVENCLLMSFVMCTLHLLRRYNDTAELGTSLHRLREVRNGYQIIIIIIIIIIVIIIIIII
jgi:hypothetical protein